MNGIELYKGNCLKVMQELIDKGVSVGLILTDPPYGTIKGLKLSSWSDNTTDWDVAIDPNAIYEKATKILSQNRNIVLFSQEPYTRTLIKNSSPQIKFCYRMIWVKDSFGNYLSVKQAPVSFFEDIVVLRNKCPNKYICAPHKYVSDLVDIIGFYELSDIMFEEGRYKNVASARKNLSKKLYGEKRYKDYNNFFDRKMLEFLSLKIELGFDIDSYLAEASIYKIKNSSVFNLLGANHKSNILKYPKDKNKYHPTQKPVALLEDLIKTYTNEGDTVLDFTMGSGSTGVACVNTGRKFIGIELDDKYFDIAENRIKEAINNKQSTLF